MSSFTQITAAHVSSTGAQVTTGNTRLRAATISQKNGSAGALVVKNGSATGTTLWKVDVPGGGTSLLHMILPDAGIRCERGIYVSVATSITSTLYYDGGP